MPSICMFQNFFYCWVYVCYRHKITSDNQPFPPLNIIPQKSSERISNISPGIIFGFCCNVVINEDSIMIIVYDNQIVKDDLILKMTPAKHSITSQKLECLVQLP